jgi:hypothetical protein
MHLRAVASFGHGGKFNTLIIYGKVIGGVYVASLKIYAGELSRCPCPLTEPDNVFDERLSLRTVMKFHRPPYGYRFPAAGALDYLDGHEPIASVVSNCRFQGKLLRASPSAFLEVI